MGPPFFMLVFSFHSYYASVIRKSNSALGRNAMPSDRTALFNILFPKADPHIRSLPPTEIYEEQFLDLHSFSPSSLSIHRPWHIPFGLY